MPTIALATLVNCGNEGQPSCTLTDLLGLIPIIIDFIIYYIVTPAAILFLTIGGLVILVSGGNPELKNKGKEIIVK